MKQHLQTGAVLANGVTLAVKILGRIDMGHAAASGDVNAGSALRETITAKINAAVKRNQAKEKANA